MGRVSAASHSLLAASQCMEPAGSTSIRGSATSVHDKTASSPGLNLVSDRCGRETSALLVGRSMHPMYTPRPASAFHPFAGLNTPSCSFPGAPPSLSLLSRLSSIPGLYRHLIGRDLDHRLFSLSTSAKCRHSFRPLPTFISTHSFLRLCLSTP